jgi:DNA ligase (NAD+)
MASKLHKNISKSKTVDLARFLTGLGITGAGLTSWEKLIVAFGSLAGIQSATIDDIAAVEGFAEKSASQIWAGLQERQNLIAELIALGCKPKLDQAALTANKGILSGKQIAITGALSQPRADIQKLIKAAGGKPASAVSKNTHAVVTGDPDSTSSKMQTARELGVPIWSEEDLMKILGSC